MYRALMLIVGQEQCDRPVEINHDGSIDVLTFSATGQYILTADGDAVQMWGVEDGKQMARMTTWRALCLAVSQDGRWIAAGTDHWEIIVWDTKTFENFSWTYKGCVDIREVYFSPDSTRLVAAVETWAHKPKNGVTVVWDIATREQAQTLDHEDSIAATYSPQGNRIATAPIGSIRIWDSDDGRLIRDIKDVRATKVLWQSNDHLLVISRRGDSTIFQQIDASTGTISAEWPADPDSCIAAPKHGNFIVYSTGHIVTIWDVLTRTQLGLIQHTRDVASIALSPDGRFLAIGDKNKKITIENLSCLTASIHLIAL